MNNIGMNLAKRDQRPEYFAPASRTYVSRVLASDRAQSAKKRRAVTLHRDPGILFGEPQIQSALAVNAGDATPSGGKSVDQPRDRAQMPSVKNGGNCFLNDLAGSPSRHTSMLQEERLIPRMPVHRPLFHGGPGTCYSLVK